MASEFETLIKRSDVVSMFPTFVWNMQLMNEIHKPLDARIIAMLKKIRCDAPPLEHGQGWQSDQALHERQELHALVECINVAAKSVLEFLRIGYDRIEITGCWANIYAAGATHRMHNHPNNFLSGVYYMKTRPGADTINFHDPRNQVAIIRPPVTELTDANTDQVVVKVQNGTLLLFPSYLQHSVDPNESGTTRISISFNMMFSGFTENLSKPLW